MLEELEVGYVLLLQERKHFNEFFKNILCNNFPCILDLLLNTRFFFRGYISFSASILAPTLTGFTFAARHSLPPVISSISLGLSCVLILFLPPTENQKKRRLKHKEQLHLNT